MPTSSKFSTVFMSNDAFKKYWHSSSIWTGYSVFFSVITIFYLLQKILNEPPKDKFHDTTKVVRIIISSIVLILLPFASSNRFKYFFVTGTSVVLLAAIINLEGVFERRQSFVTLYIMNIFYRTTRDHTFFDNFALCIAYSADVAAITHRNLDWYVSSNLAIWAYFFVALLFNNIYKRNSLRVWELVRLLIILREKTKKEQLNGESLVSAHLPRDILEHLFPNVVNAQLSSADHAPFVSTKKDKKACVCGEVHEGIKDCRAGRFVSNAIQNGIALEFNPGTVSPNQLRSISRVDKKSTVIIGAKVDKGNAKDCALAVDREHKVHQMLDHVAVKYQVTSIRRFGNTWIGTLGYFKSHADDNVNCYKAVLFCCEMDFIAKSMGMKLAFAVDFGAIVGGFVTSFQFDVFGQEIRWVLKMIDLHDFGRIVVSESVRQQLNVYKRSNTADPMVLFERRTIDINGKRNILTSVTNPQDLVKTKDIGQQFHLLDLDGNDDFSEQLVDGIWKISFDPANGNGNNDKKNSKKRILKSLSNTTGFRASNAFIRLDQDAMSAGVQNTSNEYVKEGVFIRVGELVSFLDPDYWNEEDIVDKDFHQSLLEKFDISFDDQILAKYSPEDLADTHQQVEEEIYKLIRDIFFPGILGMLKTLLFTLKWPTVLPESLSVSNSLSGIDSSIRESYEDPWSLYRSAEWRSHSFHEFKSMLESIPLYSWIINTTFGSRILGKTKYNASDASNNSDLDQLSNRGEVVFEAPKPQQSLQQQHLKHQQAELLQKSVVTEKKMMTWSDYAMGSKIVFQNSLLNFFIDSFFFLTCLYAIQPSLVSSRAAHSYNSTFVNLIFIHFILCQTLERISPRIGGFLLVFLHCLIIAYLPCDIITMLTERSGDGFGDFGGDVLTLLFFSFRIPSHIHQTAAFAFMDIVTSRLIMLARTSGSNSGFCVVPQSGRVSTTLVMFLLLGYYFAVEHRCLVAYLLEHKLLPYAVEQYNQQKGNTKELLCTFSPALPMESDETRGSLKWYRNSVIAAVHIKACDVISGLVEARDVARLVKVIGAIIDKSFQEFGMLKVTNFSGVYLAMICRSMGKETWDRSGAPSPYASHVLYLLRTIHARIEKFSKDHNFNVALGISLNHGSAYVGFLGNGIYCFDVAGPTRDMAVAMASHHGEGIFASRVFEADIHRIMPSDDLVHHQKIPDESNPDSYWLMLDGNFSGMQLDDFTYIGMLGRGGYGSVHLVCEKSTNTQYAVKAIALRQGSVMSKMIKRECIILQKMQHPNVVNLKYSFISNNRLYLVMSFIRGGNLKQVIERAPVEFPQLRYWFAELVLAIEYVHSVGIIHRDIKPANCMIGTDGHLKLGDFGLSKTIVSTKENVMGDSKNSVDSLGFGDEVYLKLQNFLPLKSHIVNGGMQNAERKVTALVLKANAAVDNGGNKKSIAFKNFQVEIICTKSRQEAEFSLSKNNIDAIFLEIGDPQIESSFLDTIDLIHHFCNNLFNTIPVYLLATPVDFRSMFLESGAKDCFPQANIDLLDEETFRRIFSIQAYIPFFASQHNHSNAHHSNSNTVNNVSNATGATANAEFSSKSANPGESTYRSDMSNAQGTGTTGTTADAPGRNVVRPLETTSLKNENTFVHSKSADQDHIVGTVHFIAPEVIRVRKYGKAVDWWACGVTFFVCITRQHLFKGEDKEAVFENILSKVVDLSPLLPFGEDIVSLVNGLVCHDVNQRLGSLGTDAIKLHKFFDNIDWNTVSSNNDLNYRPGQFLTKFDLKDKLQFYGESENRDKKAVPSNLREMEQRNINSLRRYNLNRERLRNARRRKRSAANRPFHIGQRIKMLVSGQASAERKSHRSNGLNSSFGPSSNSNSRSETSLSNGGDSESMMFSYETVMEEERENSEGEDDMEYSMADNSGVVQDFNRNDHPVSHEQDTLANNVHDMGDGMVTSEAPTVGEREFLKGARSSKVVDLTAARGAELEMDLDDGQNRKLLMESLDVDSLPDPGADDL